MCLPGSDVGLRRLEWERERFSQRAAAMAAHTDRIKQAVRWRSSKPLADLVVPSQAVTAAPSSAHTMEWNASLPRRLPTR